MKNTFPNSEKKEHAEIYIIGFIFLHVSSSACHACLVEIDYYVSERKQSKYFLDYLFSLVSMERN